ncbi:LPS-assembly protein LptD [Hyphococcus sp. DH-69]|uniref:LPS-assembly protein LptD n=1 Tax=Hyphococcus formosus TaxID=3143534 RepID=UPI00398B7F1B
MSTVLASVGGGFVPSGITTSAMAQSDPVSIPDEEEQETVLFEADTVTRDFDEGPIIAEGDVRAYFGERYLRADKLIYNPNTDIVIAEGNVSITDSDLETAFAGRVELSGDLRDGIAENFSALLEDNARLAADSAIQEQGARTRLSRAVYTSCNVCNEQGEGKTPTWRIKALRVTRDKERKVVRFHHAFLEMKGIPIIYAPFLQTPDPSVERQSGFLPPNIGTSSRLGFNIELPYYLAISNHQDATFFPKFTTSDGVLWQGEWRRKGNDGYHVLSGGVIDYDNTSEPTEDVPGVRWHLFGRGYRDFGDNWRVSYDIERVSDDTYLRQYDVERRGDLRQELDRGQTNQLRSNAKVEWKSGGSNLTFDTFVFQGLRSSDDSATIPYVLPLVDYKYKFDDKILGGRASIGANMAVLYRTEGIDSQRLTTSANWERDFITRGGHRFNVFAEARADLYRFQDLDLGTEICTSATSSCVNDFPGFSTTETSDFENRIAPTIGAEWSYPLTREFHGARLFLEPRVQIVASLADQNPVEILNEDSQSIEFDYAGLFDYNKSTGYDAFEDGQRMNIGLTASAIFPNGISVEGAIGQQYRIQNTNAFDSSSGLGEKSSDIVGSLNVRYKNVGIENRFRLDDKNGGIQRAESLAFYRSKRFLANLSYVRLNEENVANNLTRREELTATGRVKVLDHWSVGGAWRVDLESDQTIRQDFTVGYEDECSTFGITYRRNRTFDANLKRDNAIILTFTLKSLVE